MLGEQIMLTNLRKNASFVKYLISCIFLLMTTVCCASNLFNNVGGSLSFDNAGQLSPLSPFTVNTSNAPNAIALTPDGKLLFVTDFRGNYVSQYRVSTNGQLTALTQFTVPAGTNPWAITVSPNGKFAYVANVNGNNISMYYIDPETGLSPLIPATISTLSLPIQITITADGKFAYVIFNTATGFVAQYSVDETSGKLTPLSTPLITSNGSKGITTSPDSRYAYVTTNIGNVSQYSIGMDGQLKPLAPDVRTDINPDKLIISPDGNFAYVNNWSSNDISQYSVEANGQLIPLNPATVPTGSGPVSMAITHDGKYIYVTNIEGNISQYGVGTDGQLNPLLPSTVLIPRPILIRITPDSLFAYVVNSINSISYISQYRIKALQ